MSGAKIITGLAEALGRADETQGPIICGENVVGMNWQRDHVLIDDPLGRIYIPISDAAAVAAAIRKLAGLPDDAAMVDWLLSDMDYIKKTWPDTGGEKTARAARASARAMRTGEPT